MAARNPECLICSSARVSNDWSLDPIQIVEQLNLEWGLSELKGESIRILKNAQKISHFLCLDCEGGFWFPSIPGDAEFYESISSTYVDYRWDKKKVRQHIRHSAAILDVGAGPEPIFTALKRSSKRRYTSLDINPYVNEKESDAYTQISKIESLVSENLRFKDIVALHFLEHIENPREYFKSLALQLETGGSIWISVPNRERLDRHRPFDSLDAPPHHVTSWNLLSLQKFANVLGFQVVNAWASKSPSNLKTIRGIRKYMFLKEYVRVVFYRIPLARKSRLRGYQLLVQIKCR